MFCRQMLAPWRDLSLSAARLAVFAISLAAVLDAQTANAEAAKGPPFTREQAERGSVLYRQQCASCHGTALSNGEFAPKLKGARFAQHWGGASVGPLFDEIAMRMPPATAGTLAPEDAAALLAFILQQNDNATSDHELPTDRNALEKIMLPEASSALGSLPPGVELPPAPPMANPFDHFAPVTDTMLRAPSDGDWLSWRRTSDDLGFSPLKEINRSNVARLGVSWAWPLPSGANEVTPLVHDGVIFVHGAGDVVQALNGETGELLWQYARHLPKGTTQSLPKAMALYGDHIFLPTSDVHMVCLDAKTGAVVWDAPVAQMTASNNINGGPLIAKGHVIFGTGGKLTGENFIVALDEKTGKEDWRFSTIQRSSGPGTDTWNGIPFEKRSGGAVWTPGSYDPDLNLVFFGPSATYDTKPLRDQVPNGNNDALYTNNTVALDPDTGALRWAYDHMPNDQWDLDWAFERQIFNLPIGSKTERVVLTGGKTAIFDVMNAGTGAYKFSLDLGLQDLVTQIDPKTGAKNWDRSRAPGDGTIKTVCPSAGGGRNWYPTSLNPKSLQLFVPLNENCTDWIPVAQGEKGYLTTQVTPATRPRPNSDGKYGRLEAVSLVTHKPSWIVRVRAPVTTGTLNTAGGLVFAGYLDRRFAAYDDATGKELWQVRLNDVPNSSAITYQVNGKQYLAVLAGDGGALPSYFLRLVPEIRYPANRAPTLWVFKIPG